MTEQQIRIATDDIAVTLRKVRTPAGERLAAENGDDVAYFDALECETLTWQDEGFYTDLASGSYDYQSVDPHSRSSPAIQISNEYTVINVSPGDSRSAVDVTAPKLGYGARVTAPVFSALIDKPKTFFSRLLETPFGPEH